MSQISRVEVIRDEAGTARIIVGVHDLQNPGSVSAMPAGDLPEIRHHGSALLTIEQARQLRADLDRVIAEAENDA